MNRFLLSMSLKTLTHTAADAAENQKKLQQVNKKPRDASEHYFIHIIHLDGGEWHEDCEVRAQWQFAIKMHTFIHMRRTLTSCGHQFVL